MLPIDIVVSSHAISQMRRRRVTVEDIALARQFREYVDGREAGTGEACIDLDGRPITIVYDMGRLARRGAYYVVTALRRRCEQ